MKPRRILSHRSPYSERNCNVTVGDGIRVASGRAHRRQLILGRERGAAADRGQRAPALEPGRAPALMREGRWNARAGSQRERQNRSGNPRCLSECQIRLDERRRAGMLGVTNTARQAKA